MLAGLTVYILDCESNHAVYMLTITITVTVKALCVYSIKST